MSLKLKIKNLFEENRGLAIEVAKKAGFKNATPLYKFLSEPDREMDNFNCLLKIVRELFDNEIEIMSEYIKTLDPNKKTARYALEYTNIYKMDDLHSELIEKLSKCKNTESKEWAKVYSIDKEVVDGNITNLEAIDMINDLTLKSIEMQSYGQIVKFYNYYDLKLIDTMTKLKSTIRVKIEKVKDDFIKDSYLCRLALIMADVSLHNGCLTKIRRLGEKVLSKNISQGSIMTMIYVQVGNSYIFESFEKANLYLQEARKISEKNNYQNGIKQSTRSLNFLYNYHCKNPEYLNYNSDEISDIHEIAFSYIRKNDPRGLGILEALDLSLLSKSELGFHFFMKGLATGNKDNFYESLEHFNEIGEKFFKQASLIELEKLGENKYVLRALAV
jgi:hypothetical protein